MTLSKKEIKKLLQNNFNHISFGLINFTNCLPINYVLEKWAPEDIIISRGHPALINQLMKDAQIHVAPISAFEYLMNENDYILIKEACITSDAECGSVILFSGCKLEDLKGKRIGVPYDSATSIAMLKVLLNEKGILAPDSCPHFVRHKYEKSLSEALDNDFDAVLYIGDAALKARYNYKDRFYQYDLGTLWKETTGLPPVFGTWAARADWASAHKDDFDRVKFLINKAVEAGLGIYFNEVVEKAALELGLPYDFVKDYLSAKIKYNFTPEHEKSLNIFKELYNGLNRCSQAGSM